MHRRWYHANNIVNKSTCISMSTNDTTWWTLLFYLDYYDMVSQLWTWQDAPSLADCYQWLVCLAVYLYEGGSVLYNHYYYYLKVFVYYIIRYSWMLRFISMVVGVLWQICIIKGVIITWNINSGSYAIIQLTSQFAPWLYPRAL